MEVNNDIYLCKTDCEKPSIVTPRFNQGRYARRNYTFYFITKLSNLEYIIIDGGSTDSLSRL
jgi:hypothetical protein